MRMAAWIWTRVPSGRVARLEILYVPLPWAATGAAGPTQRPGGKPGPRWATGHRLEMFHLGSEHRRVGRHPAVVAEHDLTTEQATHQADEVLDLRIPIGGKGRRPEAARDQFVVDVIQGGAGTSSNIA